MDLAKELDLIWSIVIGVAANERLPAEFYNRHALCVTGDILFIRLLCVDNSEWNSFTLCIWVLLILYVSKGCLLVGV